MNSFQSKGIVLKRVEYSEADRIVTFITPEHGQITAMAKGVRKPKSKLAGGIELFAISDLTLLKGKRDLDTLMSTKIDTMYRDILSDYDRLEVGYHAIEFIAVVSKEDSKQAHYELLKMTFELLNNVKYSQAVIELWFYLQLANLEGFLPNLSKDNEGNKLEEDSRYSFSIEEGEFSKSSNGKYGANEIKTWRILSKTDPNMIGSIKGLEKIAQDTTKDIQSFARYHIR